MKVTFAIVSKKNYISIIFIICSTYFNKGISLKIKSN